MNLIAFLFLALTSSGYTIGDKINDFKLKNTTGNWVSLSDYKSEKGVILIFDCNTCPYSKAYNDRIVALHSKFAPKGFPVVTVNSNDSELSPGDSYKEMVKHAQKKNYNFAYLHDEDQLLGKQFSATNTPQVFLLAKSGNDFILVYKGAIDNNVKSASEATKFYVEAAVLQLLEGKPVSTPETKAVGCGIKYRK